MLPILVKHAGIEQLRVSPLTGEKSKKSTTVKDYMLFCDHIVSIDDFKILATSDSCFHVKVKESLLMSRDEPILKVPIMQIEKPLSCLRVSKVS